MEYNIEYEGGHPQWDKPTKAILTVDKKEKKITLSPKSIFSIQKPITISTKEILSIDFEKNASRSAGKTVAGALIGGALTGGVGLLIGGALGAKKKNLSELYLTICYKEREFVVVLKTGKQTERIYSEINSILI